MTTNENKIKTILEIMKQINDNTTPQRIKELKNNLESFILDNKKEEHKNYMENIINSINKINNPTKREALIIPVKELDDSELVKEIFPIALQTSKLQNWIEEGKVLIEKEIEDTDDYVLDIQEQIEILQQQINVLTKEMNDEIGRIDNLEMLLETVSL